MKISAALRVFLLLSFLPASMQAVYAQAGSGTIVGTVTDPSGAVIPSAKITVTDHNTGTSREVTANSQGYYVVPTLPPAVYDIAVSSPNFQVVKHNGVTLLADQHLTLDVQLTIAGSKQVVSVSDVSPSQVDTTSSTLSQVVEQKRIVDLPLNGRNAVQLATLVPGAIQAPAGNADQGQYKTLPVAITISADGSRANQTAFNLDGSSNNDVYTNVNQPFPFPDALQEFSVQTSDYTARYGGNSGAVVNTERYESISRRSVRIQSERDFQLSEPFRFRARPAETQSVWRCDRRSGCSRQDILLFRIPADADPR